ncbi:MAG: NAD(P)-dependent oxidoreductase, partial [Alphaproteobacteria bacterium]
RLVEAGHNVTVYNRTAAKAEALARLGAAVAATPREAAHDAAAVLAMVGDDTASRAVWLGPDGALAAPIVEGGFAVECSTLSHDWVLELARMAGKHGLRYLDSPVTGLPEAAAAGELTLLMGGAPADIEAARPILEPLCSEIIHFGPIGAGTAYKLVVNLIGSIQIASAAEGMLIAEKAGLDPSQVAEALARGAAASPQVVRNTRRMVEEREDVAFSGRWRLKDVRYGLALAEKVGQSAAFGRATAAAYQDLVDRGLGDLNESKVIDVLRS